jgi:hypothetical protein
MATSGNSAFKSGYATLTFAWERTNVDLSTRSSTIRYTLTLGHNDPMVALLQADKYTITVTIDGTTYNATTGAISISRGSNLVIHTGEAVIRHNSDGTKTFNYSVSADGYRDSGSQPPDFSGTGSGTLDIIATQASIVSCTTVNIGVAPVITISAQNSSFKHTLSYGFGDQEHGYITGTIAELTTAKQISNFVWPTSFYQVIPDSKSGTGTIFCDTYTSSGVKIGEQTRCTFTANVNEGSSTPVFESGYPIIKDTCEITKALTGDESKLIRYASIASVTVGGKGRNYATIVRQKTSNAGWYFEGNTGSFGNVESGLFSFELEDSRGFITKPGRDLLAAGRFIEYFHPTCNIGNDKPDANGNVTINCHGAWFNQNFGAANNTLIVQYRYRPEADYWLDTEEEWHDMTVTEGYNSYQAMAAFVISDFDYRNSYIFQTRVKDKLFTANSIEYAVKSLAVFSWSAEDFAFNVPVIFNAGIKDLTIDTPEVDLSQYALKADIPAALPNPSALTINGQKYDGSIPITINIEGGGEGADLSSGGTIDGDLTITGNLRLKGDGNYGNKIYMGDGSYVSFSEDTDDDLTIKATDINLNGNVKVNGSPIGGEGGGTSGTWTPSLNSSAISSYSVRQGWYQQVGNVVTLGFNIKATCYSGYNSTSISISGLPVTPRYDASGGGMCSGAYVSAGFNFECWVASTGGTITGRVQACNNTSATNLSTSASGLFYRSGGGEITLSGTICYITN